MIRNVNDWLNEKKTLDQWENSNLLVIIQSPQGDLPWGVWPDYGSKTIAT
jgi:hypothetical protein